MLTVEEYGRIRIAHRDGMSIRQIARRYGHSRRKIRQVLGESEPHPYTLLKGRPAPRLGPYKPLIEQILAAGEQDGRSVAWGRPRPDRDRGTRRPNAARSHDCVPASEQAPGHRDLRGPAEWLDSDPAAWRRVASGSVSAIAIGHLDGAIGCASDNSSCVFESMSDAWIWRHPISTGAQEFFLIRMRPSIFLPQNGFCVGTLLPASQAISAGDSARS